MELRRCSYFHFIRAIKSGLVLHIPNVTRGRPALKFKKIEDILESENAKYHNICPGFRPRVVSEGWEFDLTGIKIETNPQATVFNCIGGHDRQNSNLDDLSFGDMTLKQIKEKCKAKKRKLSSFVNSSKETVETCSTVKPEYPDDDWDLNQPLSSWKSELSKNKKRKKKNNHTKNSLSASSQSALVVVKSEQYSNNQEFLQSSGFMPVPIDIKAEVPEVNFCDSQDMIHDASDSSLGCDGQLSSGGGLSGEVPKISSNCALATGLSGVSTNESQCFINEVSYEYQEHAEPNSAYDVGTSGWEIVRLDSPEIVSHQYPEFPASEYAEGGYMIRPLPLDIDSATILPTLDHFSEIHYNFQSDSPVHKMSFQITSNNEYPPASTTFDNSLQCLEYIKERSVYLLADDTSNDLHYNLEPRAISLVGESRTLCNYDLCSSPDSCLTSVPHDRPKVEEKKSQTCADTAKISSLTIHPGDHSDKLMKLSGADHEHIKPQHPPERLFSTRKFQAISPTSQARLCKEMESMELHGNGQDISECKGKLKFGKPGQIRRGEVSTNQQHFIRKMKYKEDSHPKGILKGPHQFPAVQSSSSGCPSRQSCSQSAITFSQRQMRDIECLADRLTKELNSMKHIVRETVYFEASSATALKHNVDKVRMAIENATKVEESAKRYLSMMARDCSRFCKIMKLSDDDAAASKNVVPKGRRKITFADEAGKKLCHVKIFDDDAASLMESSGGKRGLLVR